MSLILESNINYQRKNEENSYSRKATQYLADATETKEEYAYKRTVLSIVYNDRAMPSSPSLWIIINEEIDRVLISRERFDTKDEAFEVAHQKALDDMKTEQRMKMTISNYTIRLEHHIGGSPVRKGTPGSREERFMVIKYEIVKL
jgi:hypothetical protein